MNDSLLMPRNSTGKYSKNPPLKLVKARMIVIQEMEEPVFISHNGKIPDDHPSAFILKSYPEPGTLASIGWIAVGSPVRLFSPDQHDEV